MYKSSTCYIPSNLWSKCIVLSYKNTTRKLNKSFFVIPGIFRSKGDDELTTSVFQKLLLSTKPKIVLHIII